MDKWNARYPADLLVDLLMEDIPAFLAVTREIYLIAEAALLDSTESEEDEAWMNAIHRKIADDLLRIRQDLKTSGYESLEALGADLREAENMATTFAVTVAEVLRDSVDGVSLISLNVWGLPSVSNIVAELEARYPLLRRRDWWLRIDGAGFETPGQLVLPGQALSLVPPEEHPKTVGFGPGPALLSALLLFFATILQPTAYHSIPRIVPGRSLRRPA
jgi:hypothetical protein